MSSILRNFLYLDDRLTSQYLAQLEGGVYEEEGQSRTEGQNRGGEAGAKAGPLSAKGSKGHSAEDNRHRTMRQTPEGNYRRLESLLQDEDAVQWLDAFDDDVWLQLRRGEVLQIESNVAVPSIFTITEMATSIGPFMDLMQDFGEELDQETKAGISLATQIGSVLKETVVVAHAAGTPKYKFICPLKPEFLRDDVAALDGESIVVGTLQRRLKPNERYSILDSLGMGGLPRAERRQVEKDLKKDLPDAVVSGPAAIITPLAIYR